MCLSNGLARLLLVFAVGLTIGKTPAIAQAAEPVAVFSCRVQLMDQVILASGIPGILDFVEPSEGDDVKAEQQIIGLDAEVATAQKAVAEKEAKNDVEIRYAIKAAALAEAEYSKSMDANRRLAGTVAAMEVERLRLAADRATLQIEQAEHQLAINKLKAQEADAQLQAYYMTAPFDGIVTRTFKSRGEAVRQGDPILEIQSTKRVKVEGYVSVKDSFRIKRGDEVKVQLDLPDLDLEIEKRELEGRLQFVDVSVESVTGRVRVWAEVQNPDNILRAGLTAKMTIIPAGNPVVQTGK